MTMHTHYSQAIKSEYADESPRELLAAQVTVLVGVDDDAKEALGGIDIETVHDLATSPSFETARAVYETASSGAPSGGADRAAAMAAANQMADGDFSELAAASIDELEGIDESVGNELRSALGVTSVRDLAKWPPYEGARSILGAVTGIDAETEQGVPEELVPIARKYATEKTYYTKVYLDERVEELEAPETGFDPLDREDIVEDIAEHGMSFDWAPQWDRIARALEESNTAEASDIEEESELESEGDNEPVAGLSTMPQTRTENLLSTAGDRRVDITTRDPEIGGFRQPAVGGILQFTQKWIPQGLSLGQLLHSTTLAPGESTKVAVIDWSRRERGEREEAETQTERTEAGMTQNRSMQEIQDGVTSEIQSGRSFVSASSTTTEVGGITQSGANMGIISGGSSTSTSVSNLESTTTAVKSSRGRRKVHAEMSQKIQNSTQQHASASRTRRATVVRETEQEESEEVRTRVVTNHNHMHSLNVHYYEVVQIFRVEVGPEGAQPVLFVPFKPIDFSENEDIIHQYRDALRAAALSLQTRDLLDGVTGYMWLEPGNNFDVYLTGSTSIEEMGGEWSPEGNNRWRLPTDFRITEVNTGQSVPAFGIDFVIERSGDKSDINIQFPDSAGTITDDYSVDVDPPVPIGEVEAVEVDLTWKEDDSDHGNHLQPGITLEGPNRTTAKLQMKGYAPPGLGKMQFLRGRQRNAKGELAARLNQNQLHYSQAIWKSLDPQTVTMLLSGRQIDGRAAIEYVDPRPEATHGNYVAFPLAIPDSLEDAPDETYAKLVEWWNQWTDRNYDADDRERDLIPLPSGGVHSEAILGRANSAEKLDITRFWDWQESPIPQEAPQVAPIQTGSRASDQDLTPSGFESPIINLQQPQDLPDPTGVGAVLDTLGQSGIFRDMSGMDAAAEVAKSAQQVTGQGARHAADNAARTFEAASQARVQQTETLANLVESLASGGEFSAQNAGNSSYGAMHNEAKKIGGGGSVGGTGGSSSAGGSGSSGGRAGSGSGTGGSGGSGGNGSSGGGSGGGGGSAGGSGGSLASDMLRERAMGGGPTTANGGGSADVGMADSSGDDDADSGRSYIIPGQGVSPERRAFNPSSNDKSGTINLNVRVPELPADATVRWSVPSAANGDIALGDDPNNPQSSVEGRQVTVMGLTPGLTELDVAVVDDSGTVLESVKYDLCVPVFVRVTEHADFDAKLGSYHLQNEKQAILQEAKRVCDWVHEESNVRTVWEMAPFGESLPDQFTGGGPASNNVTEAELAGDPPRSGLYGQTSTGPSGNIGPSAHDEQINAWIGAYEDSATGGDVERVDEATNQAVRAVLNANQSSPDIQGTAIKVVGRLTGETLAHEIGHALIGGRLSGGGHNNPAVRRGIMNIGRDRSITDRTGLDIEARSTTDLNHVSDNGIGVINIFQHDARGVIDSNFPVPPAFD